MINPPMTAHDFTRNFKVYDLVCTWSKMIDPLQEILKLRFSVHIVKDDWPPTPLTAHDLTRNFKV